MNDILKRGYAGIFIRLFNESQNRAFNGVERMTYTHSEKADDSSTIVIKTNNTDIIDDPDLQAGKILYMVFGYTSGENQKRKVYIWEAVPEFTTDGITLTIECYCKKAYLKLNTSKNVYNDSTLPEILEDVADTNGLEFVNLYDEAYVDFQRPTSVSLDGEINTAVDATAKPEIYRWKKQSIAQGNRSDAKMINDVADTEPASSVVVEGRDDELIIRRRNLKQKAYLLFGYKTEPGNLIDLTVTSSAMASKKYGVANSTSAWDESAKEYLQAAIGATETDQPALGDEVEVNWRDQLNWEGSNKLRSEINPSDFENSDVKPTVDGLFSIESDSKDENGNPIYKKVYSSKMKNGQNNYVVLVKRGGVSSKLIKGGIDTDDVIGNIKRKEGAYVNMASETTQRIERRGLIVISPKEFIPSTEDNIEDAAAAAANRQAEKQLHLHEFSVNVIGEPKLESGKVITLNGLGKKYSGNFYVSSVSHELDMSSGYICRAQLLRNALNTVGESKSNFRNPNAIGIEVNNSIAQKEGTTKMVDIPTRDD